MSLQELDAELARLEALARWSDVARGLEQRSALVDAAERVATLTRLMRLYVDRFSNHALGIQAAERVLEIEPNEEAIAYLRRAYQLRRDWEKLARLEASLADR